MNIVTKINNATGNFIPTTEFNDFFSAWEKDQENLGFNWSVNSIKKFREVMITGILIADALSIKPVEKKEKIEEAVKVMEEVKEKIEETDNKRTRNRLGNLEQSVTIESGGRTRTRTRSSN